MKSLMLKSLLLISVITVTSVLAWSETGEEKVNPNDTNLGDEIEKAPTDTAGTVPQCKYSDKRCFKNEVDVRRLKDQTTVPTAIEGSDGPAGHR